MVLNFNLDQFSRVGSRVVILGAKTLFLELQSKSVITSITGPSICVRYNREFVITDIKYETQNYFISNLDSIHFIVLTRDVKKVKIRSD